MLGDKFRFRFAKTGTLRLLSHHDLMRCLERMLRRADLPFKSTAGFHPSPRVVFALSLPLGVEGLDEVLEIEFTRALESEEVLAKLRAEAPIGLTFSRISVVPMKATAIPRRMVYRLEIPVGRLTDTGAACTELMGRSKVWVNRLKPGPKRLNIRPYLRSVRVEPSEGVLVLSPAGISNSLPQPSTMAVVGLTENSTFQLILDLWVTQTGTARVDELLDLLDLADLSDAGAVVERATIEIRDELSNPDPADVPPDGPAETLPLDPAAVADLVRRDEEQHTAVGWSASPAGPVVE